MSNQVELRKMLSDLLDLDSGLSEWEIEFIESMTKRDYVFTFSMADKIEELWNKHF